MSLNIHVYNISVNPGFNCWNHENKHTPVKNKHSFIKFLSNRLNA